MQVGSRQRRRPQYEQRHTARIPDATIRCGKLPRVLFEVISPSELSHKRRWDEKRSALQAIEGVQEIVEIFQNEMLAHVYRRLEAGRVFESIAGTDAATKAAQRNRGSAGGAV